MIELPATADALLDEIARASLARIFREGLNTEIPDYLLNDKREIGRARREWRQDNAGPIALLGTIAKQALTSLERRSLTAAVTDLTSSFMTQKTLDQLLTENPYIAGLIRSSITDDNRLRQLLGLFVQMKDLDH